MSTGIRNRSRRAVNVSRSLRQRMSESEKLLWNAVRKKQIGFVVKRQFPVGPYFLDFYVAEATLCIEVDGELHALKLESDRRRDQFLAEKGIEVLRVPSLDVFGQLDAVLSTIHQACHRRTGRNPRNL